MGHEIEIGQGLSATATNWGGAAKQASGRRVTLSGPSKRINAQLAQNNGFEISAAAGLMNPSHTTITQAARGLTYVPMQRSGYMDQIMGRIPLDGERRAIQFVVTDDHYRRPGTNALVREPGGKFQRFEPRIDQRTIVTQGYGLSVSADGDAIRRADAALGANILDLKEELGRARLMLELDAAGISFLTTSGNYAASHAAAVGTVWGNAASTPSSDIRTAMTRIYQTCGALDEMQGEWVGFCGIDVMNTLQANADVINKWLVLQTGRGDARLAEITEAAVAAALGLSRIVVIKSVVGPATMTSSAPVKTSNTFQLPSTNDVFGLLWIDRGVSASGFATPGRMTACGIATQYGPWSNSYMEGGSTEGPEGQVECRNIADDWAFTPGAVDNATDANMVLGYLLQDVIS